MDLCEILDSSAESAKTTALHVYYIIESPAMPDLTNPETAAANLFALKPEIRSEYPPRSRLPAFDKMLDLPTDQVDFAIRTIQEGMYRLSLFAKYLCQMRCSLVSPSTIRYIVPRSCRCRQIDTACVSCAHRDVHKLIMDMMMRMICDMQFYQMRLAQAYHICHPTVSNRELASMITRDMIHQRIVLIESDIYRDLSNALAANATPSEQMTRLATCPDTVLLVRLLRAGYSSDMFSLSPTWQTAERSITVEV